MLVCRCQGLPSRSRYQPIKLRHRRILSEFNFPSVLPDKTSSPRPGSLTGPRTHLLFNSFSFSLHVELNSLMSKFISLRSISLLFISISLLFISISPLSSQYPSLFSSTCNFLSSCVSFFFNFPLFPLPVLSLSIYFFSCATKFFL